MARNTLVKGKGIHFRPSPKLRESLLQDSQRSGWSLSDQIRFELEEPRGLWHPPPAPYRPGNSEGRGQPKR
jgi:hypothetical protein